ncbi:hypothetical protein AV530_003023 [Patagioenas fasciata monilis]|uniref:Uncharacterized protein n=1 Tax=Patagioenas fasciata monilis TaxID=372326 RepID=A0A1V4KVP8_PATFA|nr:hypothetical protein AV530_003023 [Patagioenas fasciata monilis]
MKKTSGEPVCPTAHPRRTPSSSEAETGLARKPSSSSTFPFKQSGFQTQEKSGRDELLLNYHHGCTGLQNPESCSGCSAPMTGDVRRKRTGGAERGSGRLQLHPRADGPSWAGVGAMQGPAPALLPAKFKEARGPWRCTVAAGLNHVHGVAVRKQRKLFEKKEEETGEQRRRRRWMMIITQAELKSWDSIRGQEGSALRKELVTAGGSFLSADAEHSKPKACCQPRWSSSIQNVVLSPLSPRLLPRKTHSEGKSHSRLLSRKAKPELQGCCPFHPACLPQPILCLDGGRSQRSNCWTHRPHHCDAPGTFDYIRSLLLWRIRVLTEEQEGET